MKKRATQPRTIKVGTYQLGYRWVDLLLVPGSGAHFDTMPDGRGHSKITVGMDYYAADKPWGALIHEVMEFSLSDLRGRFVYNDVFDDRTTDCVVFHFDHNQLNEVAARVGFFAHKCHDDFFRAFRKYHR